jgi:hypothetical protein
MRTESRQAHAGAVHFFLDDYQFETAWHRPSRALGKVAKFAYAITPDFSIWSHWPAALQYYNLYRSRWCGAYWLSHGATVIPAVSWAGPDSYRYTFAGIVAGCTVAISTVGVTIDDPDHLTGLVAMVETIRPSNILCYGRMLGNPGVPFTEFPTYWQSRPAHLHG